jgi:hypothetical protein
MSAAMTKAAKHSTRVKPSFFTSLPQESFDHFDKQLPDSYLRWLGSYLGVCLLNDVLQLTHHLLLWLTYLQQD